MGAPLCLNDDDDNPFEIAQLTSYTLTTCFCEASCDQWSSGIRYRRVSRSLQVFHKFGFSYGCAAEGVHAWLCACVFFLGVWITMLLLCTQLGLCGIWASLWGVRCATVEAGT